MVNLNANRRSALVPGPVRRIGVQRRSITGSMPNGARYESALERDLMLLLQFDYTVDLYTPQPLKVHYKGGAGELKTYTPDGLIEWRKDLKLDDYRPVLVEVKYRADIVGCWREMLARFRAARAYAKEQGWVFAIYTEREIRTIFLENVRFLLPYRNRTVTTETMLWVKDALEKVGESTPTALLNALYRDKWNQAATLPVIWKLLAERQIGCDFTRTLTMASPIWSLQAE
jgi:TnsA endonuclease C terminal/TnsA endonuclease N terminal